MTAPVLSFRHVFGFKSDVLSPLHYIDDATVLFAAGHQLVLHNTHTRQQRTIPASDMNGPQGATEICALALSPNKRYVAMCERCVGSVSFPYLTVVDLRSLKKRRSFGPALHQQAAAACAARPFQSLVSLCFSSDSKHILCLSAGPDSCVLEWQWQKEQLTASGLLRASDGSGASAASLPCVARSASYCPTDNSVVCVTGDGVLQLLNVDWDSGAITDIPPSSAAARSAAVESEDAATAAAGQLGADSSCEDVDVSALDVSCHAWLSESRVLLATRTGQLLIAHNGRITGHTNTTSVQLTSGTPASGTARAASSTTAGGMHAAETAEQRPSVSVLPAKSVYSLAVHSGGFIAGCDGGIVQCFVRSGDGSVSQRAVAAETAEAETDRGGAFPFTLESCHAVSHHPAPLVHVCLSPSAQQLAVCTDTQQAFKMDRPLALAVGARNTAIAASTGTQPQAHDATHAGPSSASPHPSALLSPRAFSPLLSLHHAGSVTGLSVCVRKPLVATCGVDRSLRVWNYLTLDCPLVCYFPEQPLSLSFHPSGLQLLVGFADKLRLCSVLLGEVRAYKEFAIKACCECAFSHGGHLFAAVNGTLVQVYDTSTGEQLAVFRGHTAPVRSLAWSRDDTRLVSAGVDGAVYQRRLGQSARLHELVQKGCRFTCAAVTQQERMYAVGDDRMLKEIVERSVNKTLDAGCVLTQIALSHASPHDKLVAGTENGVIRSFAFPLTGIVKDYQCHSRAVTRLALTHDDRFLVSASDDGTVAIFNAAPAALAANSALGSLAAGSAQQAADASWLTLPIPLDSPASLPSAESVGWSDDVLVSRSSLDDASSSLLELRSRVDELCASNEYQLRLHEMNYSEKVKEVGEKYALQLEHDRSKVELIADERSEMEQECGEKLRGAREQLMARLQAEDMAHQQSVLRQLNEYAQLQERIEREQAMHAAALDGLDQRQAAGMDEQAQAWASSIQRTQHALDAVCAAKQRVQAELSESMQQTAAMQDAEVEVVKQGYAGRLLVERDSMLRFKGENGIMRKKLSGLYKDVDEQKEQLKQSGEREEAVLAAIRGVESRIALQKRDMKDKDRAISEAERAISALKADNSELEKFKFVLDHQIKQLKRQIEPRDSEIASIKHSIAAIDQRLETDHAGNKTVHAHIAQLAQHNQHRMARINRSRDRARSLRRCYGVFRRVLAECVHDRHSSDEVQAAVSAILSNTAAFPAALTRRAAHSMTAQAVAALPGAAAGASSVAASAAAVGSEFARQRVSLLGRVSSLQSELASRWSDSKRANVALMRDNAALIAQMQHIRSDIKQHGSGSSSKSSALRAAAALGHNGGKQQASDDGDGSGQQREDGLRAVIGRQRAHIIALREQLHGAHSGQPLSAKPATPPITADGLVGSAYDTLGAISVQ